MKEELIRNDNNSFPKNKHKAHNRISKNFLIESWYAKNEIVHVKNQNTRNEGVQDQNMRESNENIQNTQNFPVSNNLKIQ